MRTIILELCMNHKCHMLRSFQSRAFLFFFNESIVFGSSWEMMLDKELRKATPILFHIYLYIALFHDLNTDNHPI